MLKRGDLLKKGIFLYTITAVQGNGYLISTWDDERIIPFDYASEGYERRVRHTAHVETHHLRLGDTAFIVQRYEWQNNDFSPYYTYMVYEPAPAGLQGDHQTITKEMGLWWGQVDTRYLPACIDALPYGDTRSKSVQSYQAFRAAIARELVALARFPE